MNKEITQEFLNKMWDDCNNGNKPGNWAATSHGDVENLRCSEPDQLWERKTGGKKWVQCP